MRRLDGAAIATRIRDLLRLNGVFDVAAAAKRLAVDEVALRISTDETSPYPSVDVLAAVIEVFGVDPLWLLDGRYSSSSHYGAMQSSREGLVAAMVKLLGDNQPQRPNAPPGTDEDLH